MSMMPKDDSVESLVQFLISENVRLATEVDVMSANLKYLTETMNLMSVLLTDAQVPFPTEEMAKIEKRRDERVERIKTVSDAVCRFQNTMFDMCMRTGEKSAGMRTGEKSAGMRTGNPVTEDDIENILRQID